MNLADVLTVVLVILGLLAVFVGVWLLVAGLFPRTAERCAARLGEAPGLCAIVGLGVLLPLVALGVAVGRISPNAPGKILSVLIFIFILLGALAGSAGLALRVGQGLPSSRDAAEPWRRMLRGGIVLALTFLTLVMIPLALVPGLGALVLGLGSRRPVSRDA
jgi:hypothetical protein